MKLRYILSVATAVTTAVCALFGFTGCNEKQEEHIHNLVYHAAVEADCENGGNVEYWICSDCGKMYKDEAATTELQSVTTAALGHSLVHHSAVDADCENGGNVEYWSCTVCGKLYADEAATTLLQNIETDALGHDFGDWSSLDDVSHTRSCQRDGCDETETEPHTLNEDNQCTVCGYVYEVTGTEGLSYAEDDTYDGYTVSMGTATASEIVIPYYYKGRPVTSIAEKGFYGANITSVEIPDSVVSIRSQAFFSSKLDGEIAFSDNISFIGSSAFSGCETLKKVTIGNGLQIIQQSAFMNCTALETVILGDGVQFIFALAFSGCKNLKTLLIGEGISTKTAIYSTAFDTCSTLSTVYYKGTEEAWQNVGYVSVTTNSYVYKAKKYFYSETAPTTTGNYWHYDDEGSPVAW